MPTEYKIFLGKGVLPPYSPRQGASPLNPCEHLAHRLSFTQFKMEWSPCIVRKGGGPHFWWQSGKRAIRGNFEIGGSMESLVEMVQIEKSLQNYVNFTLWKGLSWAFKHYNPWASGGSTPWTPGAMMESPVKIVQIEANWQFSARLHVNFTPDQSYPLKLVFLSF